MKITSGSVIGPVLVSELLAQGKNVVVIMIGSTTCEQEIRNTINTILSYQGVSAKRQLPVVSIYLENGKATMQENDTLCRINILLLASLWSGENHGLDSQDLHNFLNYHRVSNYPAALAGLRVYTAGTEAHQEKGQAVSSVISMVREGEDPNPGMVVGYHSFGTFGSAASEAIKMPSPIHLHTVQGHFTAIVNELQQKLNGIEEMYRVNPVNALSLTSVSTQDDGLVL